MIVEICREIYIHNGYCMHMFVMQSVAKKCIHENFNLLTSSLASLMCTEVYRGSDLLSLCSLTRLPSIPLHMCSHVYLVTI